jgi:RsiW-degrading membrane proteinase PrsW (M82 family)
VSDALFAALQAPPQALNPTLLGVGLLQTIVYLLFIRFIDLYERESYWYVVPVFLWGAVGATTISLILNTIGAAVLSALFGGQAGQILTAIFVAPPVEETAKGLALFVAFAVAWAVSRRRGALEFAGVMDGIVYGSAVGFGFSLVEDILYYAQAGPETFVMRRIFGGFAHAAFASLTGIGIGLIPWVRPGLGKVALPIVGLLAAISAHMIFNFTATALGLVVYALLALVILFYIILIISWLFVERRTIRNELREEVDLGTITEEEYRTIPTYFRRTGRYLGFLFSGRLGEWRLARRVHGTAVDLAFTKRLARNSRMEPSRDRVELLRDRIARLRNARGLASP